MAEHCAEEKKKSNTRFLFLFGGAQLILLVLYAVFFTDYELDSGSHVPSNDYATYYQFFSGIHIMIFLGFGYLMTFLRRSGYSALGYCFLVSAFAFEFCLWCFTLMEHIYEMYESGEEFKKMHINFFNLINADFGAAAVMITMGAMVGRVSASQLLIITVPEIALYTINAWICFYLFGIYDIGGSITIHSFGAVFGLFCSRCVHKGKAKEYPNNGNVYHSDLFAMLGTLLLWIYWPSFNSAPATSELGQYRAIVNTVLALLGCTTGAFYFSRLLRPEHKFDMVDIQNATLAGAVAMGSSADLIKNPFVSLIIGVGTSLVSVFGYTQLQPLLQRKIHLYDTCGILNLHCMPGILGGLISIAVVGFTMQDGEAAGLQTAGLFVTIGIAAASGALTGLFIRFVTPYLHIEYDDSEEWEVPSDFPSLKADAPEEAEAGTPAGTPVLGEHTPITV
ncbi:putative Ammonium transporter Rh type B [Paratrimastix pyriformis]|uniref:Ammonium transporter Rh type B n=1 Tax=Paratrimastix pyriformis TaxID=342808 RepID=A0ABQ8UUN7_9EUKA|nr:putative Ammonium transporter Rh type B [Paratrimastix pyriformis]